METYSVVHGVDIDGMSSAAFMVRYHGVELANILFAEHREDRFEEMLKDISALKSKNNLFVFADFAADGVLTSRMVASLAKLKKNGNNIIWLDHHPCSKDGTRRMAKYCDVMVVGENKENCGAELVYKVLCKKDKFGDKLARFAHIADFALKADSKSQGQLIKEYALSIKYFNLLNRKERMKRLRETIAHLSKGKFKNRTISTGYSEYSNILKKQTRALLESVKILKVGKLKIAIGFSTKLQSTSACLSLSSKFKPDIAMYVDMHKKYPSCHLRSVNGVDCSKIAYVMKGGGHPQACAFQIKGYNFSRASERERFVSRMENLSTKLY